MNKGKDMKQKKKKNFKYYTNTSIVVLIILLIVLLVLITYKYMEYEKLLSEQTVSDIVENSDKKIY